MFNSKKYSKKLYNDVRQIFPRGISGKAKQYVLNRLTEFVLLAGEQLNAQYDLTDEKREFICMLIAKWTFYKSIDMLRGKLDIATTDEILRKIAYEIYESGPKGFEIYATKHELSAQIEKKVEEIYTKAIEELQIPGEQKTDILSRSSVADFRKRLEAPHGVITTIGHFMILVFTCVPILRKLHKLFPNIIIPEVVTTIFMFVCVIISYKNAIFNIEKKRFHEYR